MIQTEGRRIYAVGDIHGCLTELDEMLDLIRADLQSRPHSAPLLLFIGDYIDRGPNSRGVVERLMQLEGGEIEARFLYGNHDDYVFRYFEDPESWHGRRAHWLSDVMGGLQTLKSYGITGADPETPMATLESFREAIPRPHLDFLLSCERLIRLGSYIFVHAGLRPGVKLEDQALIDLIWIRQGFLEHTGDFGGIVVHGHTPVHRVENHGNRIAIDTGLVFGRYLSCLVLEGNRQDILLPSGPRELPVERHPVRA